MSRDLLTSFGHGLLALLLQIGVAGPLWLMGQTVSASLAIGGALAIGWYWGREKTQWERDEADRLGLVSVVSLWWRGWTPLSWSWDGRLDLIIPVMACAGVIGAALIVQ